MYIYRSEPTLFTAGVEIYKSRILKLLHSIYNFLIPNQGFSLKLRIAACQRLMFHQLNY